MKILAAIDFSEVTEAIIDVLERMPGRDDAEVLLLHVSAPEPDFIGYDAGPEVVRDQVADEMRRAKDALYALAERLTNAGVSATPLMAPGSIVDVIFDEAEKRDVELLVVGSHGHGAVFDLLFGSISDAVVRRATLPVLVVPSRR